jgi:hypothetical protein
LESLDRQIHSLLQLTTAQPIQQQNNISELQRLNLYIQHLKNGLRMQDGAITSLIHHERQAGPNIELICVQSLHGKRLFHGKK